MDGFLQSTRKKYFWVLIVLEIVLTILMILAGLVNTAVMSIFLRVILLLVANFCVQSLYALLYSLMAIFSALNLIDPIGLFLTGHGQQKTLMKNILCIVGFFICLALGYIGYLYFKQLKIEQTNQSSGPQNANYSYFGNINQNNQNNQNETYSYGGSNYLYQNPSGDSNNVQNTRNTNNNRSNWQPFSGQGHTIG